MIKMDEPEHTGDKPVKWWDLLDETSSFLRFHYTEITEHGSDELKRAAEIVLGGHPPGRIKKGESA